MENKKYVVGIGEALWDMLPEGKKLGGAPANFAYHVSQLGLNGLVISAVGEDELGREIIQDFKSKGLNYRCYTVDQPTGTVQVTIDHQGIPCYNIMENVAWDNIPVAEDLLELARNTCAVCFGTLAQRQSLSRSTINAFLDAMPQAEGIYKIFDINLRQSFYTKEIIQYSLQVSNVLKINDEEFSTLSTMLNYVETDVEKVSRRLMQEYGLELLILTCGTNGSYVFSPESTSFIETPKVEVADTVGAGDAFTAAFIASLLKGKNIRESHQLAVDIAAYVCTQKGAMPRYLYKND